MTAIKIYRPEHAQRAGDLIVGQGPMALPHVCVRCGATIGAERFTRNLTRAPYWLFFLWLVNPLLMLIVYLVLRRPLRVEYTLCERCAKRQRTAGATVAGGTALGVGLITGGLLLTPNAPFVAAFGAVLLGATFLTALVHRTPLRIRNHRGGVYQIAGAHPACLDAVEPISPARALSGAPQHLALPHHPHQDEEARLAEAELDALLGDPLEEQLRELAPRALPAPEREDGADGFA